MTVDLSVTLGPLKLANPMMVGSGTSGGIMDRVLDVHRLGAFVEKTVTKLPRKGNPYPRVFETASGMLNSIGLEGYGLTVVERVAINIPHNEKNKNYLKAKKDKLGHIL